MVTIMIVTVAILLFLFILGVFVGRTASRIIGRIFEILTGLLFLEAIIWAIFWAADII